MNCRFCGTPVTHVFIDLGAAAVSNAFLRQDQLTQGEPIYPLKAMVCDNCFLVQVNEYQKKEEIFKADYAYFSSISTTWLKHCKQYVEHVVPLFRLDQNSLVIEIASNDGYLLQFFKQKNIPCLGVEPTLNTAEEARKRGIETIVEFFDEKLARKFETENKKPDLLIGNNVLAHAPNLNDFVRGLKICLSSNGIITLEFPHLVKLVDNNEFDTIYHEHFSYFSFCTAKRLFEFHGLEIFDVEELNTHGGSLRVYIKHRGDESRTISRNVGHLLEKEQVLGINRLEYYRGFQEKADRIKNEFLKFIIGEKLTNKRIAAFGAAAKGNTFLNYCGLKSDVIEYVADDTPSKQGAYLPQSRIPVVSQEHLKARRPDIIVILPWNFKNEILDKLSYAKEWGAKLVTYIPRLEIA